MRDPEFSPVLPVNGSLHMAPLFPRSGPGESSSPMSQVVLRCYDFPSRLSGRLFVSLPGPTRFLLASCSLLPALPGRRRPRLGPGSLFGRRSYLPAHIHVDVSGISQVPRRPILCLCPGPRPRPNRRSSPIPVPSMLPLRPSQQGLQHCSYRGYHGASAPAVYASRTVLPPPHARLASGWLAGLYRVGVEPTGSR